MFRKLIGGAGLLGLGLVAPAGAASAHPALTTMPTAIFAKKADAICTMENAKRAKGPQLTSFDPATATRRQVILAGKILKYSYPIGVDEITRVSAIGMPKEKLPAEAWTRLHELLVRTTFPAIQQLAKTGVAGKVAAFRSQFSRLETLSTPEASYGTAIGFAVCGK